MSTNVHLPNCMASRFKINEISSVNSVFNNKINLALESTWLIQQDCSRGHVTAKMTKSYSGESGVTQNEGLDSLYLCSFGMHERKGDEKEEEKD